MASGKTPPHAATTTTTTSGFWPRRPAPQPMSFTSSTATTTTTTTTSETEPLLPRDSPPPRYSTIEPEWDVPLENPTGHTANLATTHTTPANHIQPPLACPGWWSWVPGPAQVFPPGLEHLTNLSSLTIKKKGRKYCVKRGDDVIYTTRQMKDTGGMVYRVQNNANLDVLLLTSTTNKESLFSSSFLHVEVSFPPGNVVGVVQGNETGYTGHNPSGDLLFLIHREATSCCGKPGYTVETKEMLPLGALERVRGEGCCCGDRNVMELSFPKELDLRWKALLLGGALVIVVDQEEAPAATKAATGGSGGGSSGSCECGVPNQTGIGNCTTVIPPHKYPWHVGIKRKGDATYWCGGTIINNKYVLTAAHCCTLMRGDGEPDDGLVVGVGDHDMTNTTDDIPGVTRLISVKEAKVHENYSPGNDYDIAVLLLAETLDLCEHKELGAVCLPEDDSETYEGMTGIATGWGLLAPDGKQPLELYEVELPILPPSCWDMNVTENMLCAGDEEGGNCPCFMDGSPLQVKEDTKFVQVGITLFGFGNCADPGIPVFYTRVSKFLSWIKEKTADATYCE